MIIWLLIACSPKPLDGQLPAGSWGGDHHRLDVDDIGTATYEGDCVHGATDARLTAVDGALHATFLFYDDMAGMTQDTADDPGESVVTLDATVLGDVLEGSFEWQDEGWTSEIRVELGAEAVLYKCQ